MRPFVVVVAAAVGVVNIDDDDVIDDVLLFSSYIIVWNIELTIILRVFCLVAQVEREYLAKKIATRIIEFGRTYPKAPSPELKL